MWDENETAKETRPFFRRFCRSISLSLFFFFSFESRVMIVLWFERRCRSKGGGLEFSPRVRNEMKRKISKSRNLAAMFTLSLFLRVPPFLSTLINSNAKSTSIVFFFLFFSFFFLFLSIEVRVITNFNSTFFNSSFLPHPNDCPLSILFYTTQHFSNLFEFASEKFFSVVSGRGWIENLENHVVVRRRSLRWFCGRCT